MCLIFLLYFILFGVSLTIKIHSQTSYKRIFIGPFCELLWTTNNEKKQKKTKNFSYIEKHNVEYYLIVTMEQFWCLVFVVDIEKENSRSHYIDKKNPIFSLVCFEYYSIFTVKTKKYKFKVKLFFVVLLLP